MAVWKDKFININEFSRSGKKITAVRKLVLHWTANSGATALNHYNYFNNLKGRYASAHLFVDKIEALCIIPLNEVAYHANDGTYRGVAELKPNANLLSIGVEMCLEKDGSFHPDTVKRTEDVFVELCKRYKLNPLTDIVRHYDVTHKNCPAPYVSNSKLFTDFKNRVNAKLKGATVAPTTPAFKKPLQAKGDYPVGAVGKATIVTDVLNVRNNYSTDSKILGQVNKGEVYFVYKVVDGWLLLANGQWISGGSGKYATYVAKPKEAPKPTPKPVVHMYRIRKSWEDVKSQIGAYEDIQSAKDLANKNKGYKVFDENGKVVYDPTPKPAPVAPKPVEQTYRVRKDWADVASQIGAYKELENAKELADKNKGYKVFDNSGKVVYTPPVKEEPKQEAPKPTTPPVVEAPKPVEPVINIEEEEKKLVNSFVTKLKELFKKSSK